MPTNATVARCASLSKRNTQLTPEKRNGRCNSRRGSDAQFPYDRTRVAGATQGATGAQQGRNSELRGAQLSSHQELRERTRPDSYRWLVCWRNGETREICCLPEMTATELAHCYQGARFLVLPDSAAQAAAIIQHQGRPHE